MFHALIIRAATKADAEAMGRVRHASIHQLCSADHHDDLPTVNAWAGDGSATKFLRLLEQPEARLVVAEIDGQIVGLGGMAGDLVTLNYVHPDYRFRGVSKALMGTLEAMMMAEGIAVGRLNSTVTALAFYRAIGWVDAGPATAAQGQPMRKVLQHA